MHRWCGVVPSTCRHYVPCTFADQLRMKQRREQHRGKGGVRQQQQPASTPATTETGAATGSKAPDNASAEKAPGAGAEAAGSDGVDKQLQSIMDSLNTDRTYAALNNMPRHIVAKLFPWPRPGPSPACSVSMKLTRAPLLLAGRCATCSNLFCTLSCSLVVFLHSVNWQRVHRVLLGT